MPQERVFKQHYICCFLSELPFHKEYLCEQHLYRLHNWWPLSVGLRPFGNLA